MVASVFMMVSIGTQITEAVAGLDRMHEVFEEQPEDIDPQRVRHLDRIRGNVRFENVTFEYQPNKPVLRGVTFKTMPGTVTALLGPSGSGQGTLIALVAEFAEPPPG